MRRASSAYALKILAAGAAIALAAPPALAEEDDGDDRSGVVEEIVVSATYRDTRLMDTPLTISAVTAQDIVNKGIEDIQTLYQSIPGLSYRTNSQTYNTLAIRGLSPPSTGGGSTVGIYFDNMPITDANNGGIAQTLGPLFDLERVEVLKGPQGTLYGEGALGGSIRYITKKPNPSGFDYSLQANVEDIGESSGLSYRADAMVNIPLSDNFAARVVAYQRDRVGIIDQVAPRNEEDVDTFEETGARIRLTWYATDTLEISGMANVINGDYGGPGLGFHCYSESTPSTPNGQVPVYELPGTTCEGQFDQYDRNPYVTHLAHPTYQSGGYDDQTMYNFSIDWQLSFADFLSSTSYFERDTDYSEETSPRYSAPLIGCFGLCPGALATLGGDGAFFRGTERLVQEFRLVSNADSRFQWTAGAYYKDEDSQGGHHRGCYNGGSPVYDTLDTHCNLQYGFFDHVPLEQQAGIVLLLNSIIGGNTRYRGFGERSVFGEVGYQINDAWEVLLGTRYADVKYELLVGAPGVDSKRNAVNDQSIETRISAPKVTLTWRPMADWMLYLTYSSGARPGIINEGLAGTIAALAPIRGTSAASQAAYDRLVDQQTVEGDEVTNYEFGIKATVADGRVSFVGAIFQIDWDDVIISVSEQLPPEVAAAAPTGYSYNLNRGSAQSQGMEFEFRTILTESLRLNFGGNWNWKAELGAAGSGRYGGVNIEPGNRLDNAPKYSFYASLVYDFELAGFDATARADGYIVDELFFSANNELVTPGYETLDLKLLFGRNNWRLGAYFRNVTNEDVIYTLNQVGYRFGRPRTFGVQLSYNL